MYLIEKIKAYLEKEQEQIENNRLEIEITNQKLARSILMMGCLCFVPFIFISLFVEAYHALFFPYIIELTVLVLFLLLSRRVGKFVPSVYMIYTAYGSLIGYSIYTSAFVTPAYTSVIILFFLFQIPIITIDNSRRVNLVVILYAVAYMVIAVPFKDDRLIADEILNCLLFSAFGICSGTALRRVRLENLELKRQATLRERTDYLTGLGGRRCLFEDLSALETSASTGIPVGLLMIDIDYFKQYNDTYGHQAGDRCLKAVATCFADFSQIHNVSFYRYGGEEFVGMATGYDAENLYAWAQEIKNAVIGLQLPHSFNPVGVVTISIGVSVIGEIATPEDKQHLLSQADIALYTAKRSGRNCVYAYKEGMIMKAAAADSQVCPSYREDQR